MPQPATAAEKLDGFGLEAFCDAITDGKSYQQIAEQLGIARSSVARWLALDAERSARVREALRDSAAAEDDKAEAVLLDKTMDIHRARELASHYRWRARVRNPREYGEKLDINQTTTVVNLSDDEIQRRRLALEARLREAEAQQTPTPE
jgi:transcriptional regulator with XRE-family HTH domain